MIYSLQGRKQQFAINTQYETDGKITQLLNWSQRCCTLLILFIFNIKRARCFQTSVPFSLESEWGTAAVQVTVPISKQTAIPADRAPALRLVCAPQTVLELNRHLLTCRLKASALQNETRGCACKCTRTDSWAEVTLHHKNVFRILFSYNISEQFPCSSLYYHKINMITTNTVLHRTVNANRGNCGLDNYQISSKRTLLRTIGENWLNNCWQTSKPYLFVSSYFPVLWSFHRTQNKFENNCSQKIASGHSHPQYLKRGTNRVITQHHKAGSRCLHANWVLENEINAVQNHFSEFIGYSIPNCDSILASKTGTFPFALHWWKFAMWLRSTGFP